MKHKSFLLITIVLLITTLCFSGCQEQTNQNGNHTNTTTENTFLGDWETTIDPPEYESYSFYDNQTVKNYYLQKFEDQLLPSETWFTYTYDDTNLCFSSGTPGSPDYFSICYTYTFSQNDTHLTLSSNGIVIIDLVKI